MLASPSVSPTVVGLTPIEPRLERIVEQLLKAAGPSADAAVAVAGPFAGAAMSALWRRGFERVEAARRVTCPSADQLSDVLLILGCDGADQVSAVITAVLPILRQGGTLAIDASRLTDAGERLKLCQMLALRGLNYGEDAHMQMEIVAKKPAAADMLAMAS